MPSVLTLLVLLVAVLLAGTSAQLPPLRFASQSTPYAPRGYPQVTSFYGRILLYGGTDGFSGPVFNDSWQSLDEGVTWTRVATVGLPAGGRYDGALITIPTLSNNAQLLLFIGGGDLDQSYNDVYFSVDGVTYNNTGNAAFSPRSGFAYAIALPLKDQSGVPTNNGFPALYILGGYDDDNVNNQVYFSSGRGMFPFQLVTLNAQWPARCDHRVVAVESGTRLVLTGGTRDFFYNAPGDQFNDVWISNVGASSWTELTATAPFAKRALFGFVIIAEKLYVFGGLMSNSTGGGIQNTVQFGDRQTADA